MEKPEKTRRWANNTGVGMARNFTIAENHWIPKMIKNVGNGIFIDIAAVRSLLLNDEIISDFNGTDLHKCAFTHASDLIYIALY